LVIEFSPETFKRAAAIILRLNSLIACEMGMWAIGYHSPATLHKDDNGRLRAGPRHARPTEAANCPYRRRKYTLNC
jgi:hypothetical protein